MPESTDVHQDAASPGTQVAASDRYVIDPAVSRFTVQAFASGFLSAFGHDPKIAIRDLKGEIHFDPAQIAKSTMHLTIRAESLTVADNISDKDRRDIEGDMRAKVLETDKYPEINFDVNSLSVNNSDNGPITVVMDGQLSLHGVTRPEKIPATLVLTGNMLRAFGEFSLRQSTYGIKPISAVGGGLKVKDEVKFIFDIVGRKQD